MGTPKQASASRRLTSVGLFSLGFAALVLLAGQLHCADAETGWNNQDGEDSDLLGTHPDGSTDGFDDPTQCFNGTATSELQLLNHCTEADRVDRVTKIPLKTWDGTSPLPYAQ